MALRATSGSSTTRPAFGGSCWQFLLEFRDGNFAVRLPSGLAGLDGKIADAFNDIATISDRRAQDVARISRMVGKEGRVKERLSMVGMVGNPARQRQAR